MITAAGSFGIGLWTLLVAPPTPDKNAVDPSDSNASAAPDQAAPARVERLLLRLRDVDEDALFDATALRMPDTELFRFGDREFRPPPGSLHAYLEVRAVGKSEYQITVVVSDGRAFERKVRAEGPTPERALASDLGLLLQGIQAGTEAPDRSDASIPEPEPPAPEPPDEAAKPPLEEPEPPPEEPQPAPPSKAPAPAPRGDLGVVVSGGSVLGLVPFAGLDAGHAWAGAAGPRFRFPGGALIGADFRAAGVRRAPFRLLRMRVSVGGGYALRRGRFELPILAAVSVEPWWVQLGTERLRLERDGEVPTRLVPLLGAGVTAVPSLALAAGGGRFSLGLLLELAASAGFASRSGVPRVRVPDDPDRALFRLGGGELSIGLQLGYAHGV